MFDQIEDNKEYFEKVDRIKRKRMHKDLERQQIAKEIQKEDEKEWEENRDKRVKKWRKFMNFTGGDTSKHKRQK